MTYEHTIGTRAQVWHGTAMKTSGGLTKSKLMMNKHGRIVSRRKHASGKKSIKHLEKLGYKAKKGHFTLFHKGHKGSRKHRGGAGMPTMSGSHSTMGSAHNTSGTANHPMMAHKMKGGTGVPTGVNHPAAGSAMSNLMAGKSNGMHTGTQNMMKKGGRRSRKMRGGMAYGGPLSPHSYDGQGVGTSGVNLQFVAGNAA
jgi:hypothetical protein